MIRPGFINIPLHASDINDAVNGLKQVIDFISNEKKPYMQEAFFIRGYSEYCIVKVDGKEYRLHKRHCNFVINHMQESEKVFVDNRYIT